MLALTLFSAVLLATQVTATSLDGAIGTVAELIHSRELYRRQIDPSEIPTACQSQCAGTVAVLNDASCVSASCLCTTTINQGFQSCLSCVAAGDPALVAQAQEAIAQYEDACNQSGVPVASLSITGGSAASTRPVGASSVSIPAGGSQTPSVFFSSSGQGAGVSTAPVASTPVAGCSTPTRSVVTAAPVGTGNTSPLPSVSTGPVPANGAGSLSGAPVMAVAGLIAVAGAMFAL